MGIVVVRDLGNFEILLMLLLKLPELEFVAPPRGYWVVLSGEENTPLRDKDHLSNDPHEFPGFLSQRFWTLLELGNKSALVG